MLFGKIARDFISFGLYAVFLSALGDPLLKGLTEVASNRPKDPVTYLATYLYNFANQERPENENEVFLINILLYSVSYC